LLVGNSNCFILMYHHVDAPDRFPALRPFVVSPEVFQDQLKSVAQGNHNVGTVSEVLDPSSTAACNTAITFDDCPAKLLETALPELESRGWKATFYMPAKRIGGTNDWDTVRGVPSFRIMNAGELRGLVSQGHEIGAHGLTHRNLRQCTYAEALSEMRNARHDLEQVIGVRVKTFAYPYGEIPDYYTDLCHESGYESACSIFSICRTSTGDRFAIRRILVSERDTGLRLRVKLSKTYLRARPLLVDRRVLRATQSVPVESGYSKRT
jgi:peptidoglycan/xylan/chitin deacetylase (PgdA/CDA1 family)